MRLKHHVRRRLTTSAAIIALVLGLLGCTSAPANTGTSPVLTVSHNIGKTESPLPSPTSPASKAPGQDIDELSTPALTGRLVSISTSQPIAYTPVHLAEVFWNQDHTDGTYVLNTAQSPATATDGDGIFSFQDLSPTDYVLVIGEMPGKNEIVSNPDGSARVYTVRRGNVTDVGQLAIGFPVGESESQ